jgi:hypothetical protein
LKPRFVVLQLACDNRPMVSQGTHKLLLTRTSLVSLGKTLPKQFGISNHCSGPAAEFQPLGGNERPENETNTFRNP